MCRKNMNEMPSFDAEKLSFKTESPNEKTTAAILEAAKIAKDPNVTHYSDVEEALQELKR